MANRNMQRYSTPLLIREMQIKTTMRYLLTPVRMPIIKSLQTINTGEGMEKREHSCTVRKRNFDTILCMFISFQNKHLFHKIFTE